MGRWVKTLQLFLLPTWRGRARSVAEYWTVVLCILFALCNCTHQYLDDTVSGKDDTDQLQKDLSKLDHWSRDRQMLFNIDVKWCKVVHFGRNNDESKCVYNLCPRSRWGRDLDVIVHQSLKATCRYIKAVKSANKTIFDWKNMSIDMKIKDSVKLLQELSAIRFGVLYSGMESVFTKWRQSFGGGTKMSYNGQR